MVDLESSGTKPPVELEPSEQCPPRGHVRGTSPDKRRSVPNRAEQRNVPGHHDDIEQAAEVEGSQVGVDPGQVRRSAASFGNHRRIDVDPDDVDTVLGQLDGYPSRTTSCVKD